MPDGAARQVLAEYGDFPVYLVNRDLRARRVTTHELFPLRVKAGHANANAPLATTLPATAGEASTMRSPATSPTVSTAAREGFHTGCGSNFRRATREALATTLTGFPHRSRTPAVSAAREVTGHGSPRRRRSANRGDAQSLQILILAPLRSASRDERLRLRQLAGTDPEGAGPRRRTRTRPLRKEDSGSDIEATDKPADPRAWTVDDVAAFVLETTKQPAHAATFKRAKVNGALLMRIDAQDLEETLKIDKALDRRRLCTALDKLRRHTHSTNARRHDAGLKGDKQARKELDGYIDTLDRDRVRCVARLKVAFDAQAPHKGRSGRKRESIGLRAAPSSIQVAEDAI